MRQLLTIFLLLVSVAVAHPRTIVADATGKMSLQRALSEAATGDTIRIMPGVYREGNLVIKKPLTIIGVGLPVLDAENKYEIFTIAANDVTITGLKMINTGLASINDISAINAIESKRIRVLNNQFENTFFGIHLANCTGSLIEGNTLQSNAEAEHQIGNGLPPGMYVVQVRKDYRLITRKIIKTDN